MKKQAGFTLIELVIVIIILGILAAYAIPKYISLEASSRKSVIQGFYGSVRAASDLVHALAVTTSNTAAGTVTLSDGTNVTTTNGGYAAASNAGIGAALSDVAGLTVTAGTGNITYSVPSAVTPANCAVTYTAGSGNNPAPTIALSATLNCT